ncbi:MULTISPECIES: hypothetical protein [unclassified Microcoleus]|nr:MULTISPECIES: hypothetical protein [unclassified Microcoleus]
MVIFLDRAMAREQESPCYDYFAAQETALPCPPLLRVNSQLSPA